MRHPWPLSYGQKPGLMLCVTPALWKDVPLLPRTFPSTRLGQDPSMTGCPGLLSWAGALLPLDQLQETQGPRQLATTAPL